MKKKIPTVYVLRTCNADMTAYGGFKWPESGPVKAPDWSPEASCGKGLHGFLKGEGDTSLASTAPDAKWLVVRVRSGEIVDLGGKVKFPRCTVVYCGTQEGATAKIVRRHPEAACMYATVTGGDCATVTGGDRATVTGGDCATVTGGYDAVMQLSYYDGRRRIVTAYIGENGILSNVAYHLNGKHEFEAVIAPK